MRTAPVQSFEDGGEAMTRRALFGIGILIGVVAAAIIDIVSMPH